MNTDTISARVLNILEWDSILKELDSRCATAPGKRKTAALKPLSLDNIKLRLREISELKDLTVQEESPDFTGVSDIEPLIDIAVKEGVLQIGDVCRIRDFIVASNKIINFILKYKDKLRLVSSKFNTLNKLAVLRDLLYTSITDGNELNSDKYPELKNIKESLIRVKQEIEKKIHNIIHSPSLSSAIQEKIHNIRNERYVVLVKANMKDKVKGNLHDFSSSGATLYIEPEEIIGLNNKLIMLEKDYKNAIFRILKLLSKEIGKYSDDIIHNLDLVAELDFLTAASKFSISIKGNEPEISDKNIMMLYGARHPMLYLMNPDVVVPNDISIGGDYNCMIISGANTGGKTVLLKTIGLCSLLAMYGFHIPAGADSVMGIFSNILADIGDDQSIAESLSTYSGQIVIINEMIKSASEQTLILIDEILVGTNPRHGAVLAQAVLEALAGTGARIVVTTHYSELKELPSIDKRFRNASVSFDVESLKPTFKLRTGIPGTSYTIDIARIYGMDHGIIARTKELLDSRDTTTEALLENIQKYKEEVEEEHKRNEEIKTGVLKEKNEYLEMQARLNQRIEEVKSERGIEFIEEINRYRKEITDKLKSVQNENLKELEKFQRNLKSIRENVVKKLKKDGEKRFLHRYEPFDPVKTKPGDKVFITSLEKTVRIHTIDKINKNVSVILGNSIKARYKYNDLLIPPLKNKKDKSENPVTGKTNNKPKEKPKNDIPRTIQTQYNTCDLRGLTVEEAVNKLENDLDKMIRSGINTAVIIHGHGTGALKEAVRKWLKVSYYVNNSRPGEYGEGGDGVSIASLKE